jgi:hypothetical protein
MKKIQLILLLTVCLVSVSSCKKYLDVNTNPNAPQSVTANLYLSPMLHWMATSPQYDGRFIHRYTQNLTLTSSGSTWDLQGYDPASDNGGEIWRDVYWSFGQNLVDMMAKSEAEQRWDLLGVGYVLKAWGWLNVTDVHGELIIKARNMLTPRLSACLTWLLPICSVPMVLLMPPFWAKQTLFTKATVPNG